MRLIDADKLIEVFSEKKEVWRGNGVLPSNESLMWLAAMGITSNAPTVDAAPVKHGKWIYENDDPSMIPCSMCGYQVFRYNNTPYCPNCGAKMDLEEQDAKEKI